jgi:purine nucleosidase
MAKIFLAVLLLSHIAYAQPQKVWLDADTGNEMDDVFAVVRLLWAKGQVQVMGFSSAHFNNADLVAFDKWNQYATRTLNTVEESQRLNEGILAAMQLLAISHPLGADRQMGRAWGGFQPRPSAATDALLRTIKALKPNEKLDILTLGAITNIASLVAIDSTVKAKIRVYSMMGGYLTGRKVWDKNEFNVRGDLNAFDFLLNQRNLDWTIIPKEVLFNYRFDRAETYRMLDDQDPVHQLMEKRWRETNPEDKTRILWDLGLVQAYLKPALAEVWEVSVPPENTGTKVKIYAKINEKAMYDEFWEQVALHQNTFRPVNKKPNLGEVHYGNRVGGLIGQEGPTTELLCLAEDDQIQQIRVCLTPQQNVVKGFELTIQQPNGTIKTETFGHTGGGAWQPPFKVKKGLKLIGIQGAAGWFIDRISFSFDDKSTTPSYGGTGGDHDFSLQITQSPKGHFRGRVMGFWGSATTQLESIGLVFFPIE